MTSGSCLRPRAHCVPRRHRMGYVTRSRPRHVRPRWYTRQPTVHRVWMPPHRPWLWVDRAWGLAWRAVCCTPHVRGIGRRKDAQVKCRWEHLLRRSSWALLDAQGIRYDVDANA